jgi:hypothetical protein
VRINNLLRRANFLHSAFASARVHTLWLLNRSADSALAANFLARREGAGQGAITRRFALRSIAKSISFSRREGVRLRRQMQLFGVLARARADEDCDGRLTLQFRGSVVTSDARLLAYRELEDAPGLSDLAGERIADARTGKNGRHALVGMLRRAVFGRLAGYEDVTTPSGCAMIPRCDRSSAEGPLASPITGREPPRSSACVPYFPSRRRPAASALAIASCWRIRVV